MDQQGGSKSHSGEARGKPLANLKISNRGAFHLEDLTTGAMVSGDPSAPPIPAILSVALT